MNSNSKVERDLLRAAKSGKTAEVRALLDAGANVDAVDDDGFTALIWASTYGHPEVTKLLVEQGADISAY